jgi:CBS domain containing-hemolysin-like protein
VQQLGRIPDEGEELEVSGLFIRVERATPQRIVQLRVVKR